jgi:hypothetical protein
MAIKTLLELYYEKKYKLNIFSLRIYIVIQGVSKDAMEIQQAVVHHKRG